MELKIKKYEVVFVDEYNNWYFVGFFDTLEEAEPELNTYLREYTDEETGEPLELSDTSSLGRLTEYPSSFDYCFDRIIDVPEGCIQIRGFIFE